MMPMSSPSEPPTRATAAGRLLLRLAGQFAAASGAMVDLEPKDAVLLAYLAIEGTTSRARLARLLWPETDDERARGNLRVRLLRLKRTAGVELVVGQTQAALAAGVTHDLADASELLQAVELRQAGGLADWLEAQRDRHRRTRIDWLDAACTQAETEADLAAALEHANALVALDALSEHAHRRVMRLHYLRGDVAAAIAAYERCRQVLKRELNAPPSQETEALRAGLGATMVPAVHAPARRAVPLSVLRPPRLIGREAEWAALQGAWEAMQPAVVLGEAGLGKTRLVTDFARAHGTAVIVSARPGDAQVVYALTVRLLRQLPKESMAALAAPVRKELARLLPEYGEAMPIASDAERARFFNAVGSALEAAAAHLDAVVLDDLHFADEASVELMRYLSADGPLRWLFAARPGELGGAARALVDALRGKTDRAVIALAPLTERQLIQFVDALDVEDLSGTEIAAALMRQTGGNPLFVLETLKAWLAQRHDGALTRLPVVASLGAMVERRIGRLSADAVRLARCAAVAGQDFSAELAAHVLGVRTLDLADAWAELEAALVLRDGAFAHDLIYEAALASVPPPIARPLHREVADYLAARDSEPARIAAHRLAAGDRAQAVDALAAAARRCADAGRVIEAGRHYRHAAEVAAESGQETSRIFELYYEAANALWLTASTQEFNALIEPLQRWARTDSEHARCWMAEGHRAEREGRVDDYAAAAEKALELNLRAGDRVLAGICRMSLAHVCAFRGQQEKALHQFAAAADAFRETSRRHEEAACRGNLGAILSTLSRFDEANRQLELAVPGLVEHKNFAYLIANYNTRAGNALAQGDARRAIELAAQARALAVTGESEAGPRAVTLQRQMEGLRRLGRLREALDVFTEAHAAFENEENVDCLGLGVEAVPLFLDLGRTDRALALLREFERRVGASQGDVELARLYRLRAEAGASKRLPRVRGIDLTRVTSPAQRCAFVLELSRTLAGAEAAAQIEAALREARALALNAYLAALWLAKAELAIASGDASGAGSAADAATSALLEFDADDYRPALMLRLWRVESQLARHDRSATMLRQALEWLRQAEERNVPAEFRDSFLNRNPVNRELVTLATRRR